MRFIKEFSATFGIPPYQYLISVRVGHARHLLESSAVPLPDVATASGFGSAASMQHAFRRFAGASPAKVMNTIFADFSSDKSTSHLRFKSAKTL